jgi:hypothetical protein
LVVSKAKFRSSDDDSQATAKIIIIIESINLAMPTTRVELK